MSENTSTNTATNTTTGTNSGGNSQRGANARPSDGVVAAVTGTEKRTDGNGKPGTQSAQEKAEAKKFKFEKVKLRGKEVDFEADEEQVKRYIQQAHGANERYEEAKRIEKEADQKLAEYHKWKQEEEGRKKSLATNPIQAAIEAGASPQEVRRVAEEYLYGEIQKDEMSEDAKRAMKAEEELRKRDERDAEAKKDQEQRELHQRAEEARKQIVPEMLKFMDAVGVAKTAGNLSSIARRLKEASARKVPMTVERAVQLTHEDNQSFVKATVGGQITALNQAFKSNDNDTVLKIGREIEGFLGEDTLVALQRYGIVKYKTRNPNMPSQAIDTPKTKAVREEPSVMSEEEKLEERAKRVAEAQRRWELANRGAAATS